MVVVGIPIYNEEANLACLLDVLTSDPTIDLIIGVDDGSSDRSPQILDSFVPTGKVIATENVQRSGQLAGWRKAAELALSRGASTVAFIDADAIPDEGAVKRLISTLELESSLAIASGRVIPANDLSAYRASAFRAAIMHRVRSRSYPKEAIIGRFFATRCDWFLDAAQRTDIIANDTYLSCLAVNSGLRSRYVPEAICRYTESENLLDFAAQRQRADAGYRQLTAMGVLRPEHGPRFVQYVGEFFKSALADPIGAVAWVREQLRGRRVKAYKAHAGDGTWETQPSTKRRVGT